MSLAVLQHDDKAVEECIAQIVADTSGWSVDDIIVVRDVTLFSLGVYGVDAMRARSRIAQMYSLDITDIDFHIHTSLVSLTRNVMRLVHKNDPPVSLLPSASVDTMVPPRDAAERLAFASWAIVVGESAGGIFTPLPVLESSMAEKLQYRLEEKSGESLSMMIY